MSYYIRVLGKHAGDIPLQSLRTRVEPAVIRLEQGTEDFWRHIVLAHASGREIAAVDKNAVVGGQLGADELQEFIDELKHYQPESSVKWLQEYLPAVKVIYAFQLLSGTDVDDGWTPLNSLYNALWDHAGGILQADGEGFTNEKGFHILWQFPESTCGPWAMGVLQDGKWVHFEMDLGDQSQREAFRRGELPAGVKRL